MIDSYSSYALSVLGRSQRTVTEYCKEIRAFARWLAPDLDPSESLPLAVRSDVNAYLAHCLEIGNSASTRARKISALRMFYNFLFEYHRISPLLWYVDRADDLAEQSAHVPNTLQIKRRRRIPLVNVKLVA